MLKIMIVIVTFFSLLNNAFSDDGPMVVAVGEAKLEGLNLLVFSPKFKKSKKASERKPYFEITKIIRNDFSFYQKEFNIIKKPLPSDFRANTKNFREYQNNGIDLILIIGENFPEIKYDLYDLRDGKHLLSNTVNGNIQKDYIDMAHGISDAVFYKLMKKESIFKSHIVFVSDRTGTRRKQQKELYIMDYDGGQKRRLTWHRGTVISPVVSKDGQKIIYSLIPRSLNKRNIRLMIYDMKTKKSKIISNRKGINAGAVFLPGGNNIILTLSYQGNAELYKMNLSTLKTTRITKHYSPDVDPSVNFDGSKLTFLSGRSGKAMIYTMDPSGLEKNVKRISYVGKFNATPRFSPDGKQIVFSSWLDNRFDLFRLSSSGKELYRLTKDFGSNEDPTFSLDGQFIAFSSLRVISKRKADQNIYIMSSEGKIWGKVTRNFGNCITPRWSK